MAMSGYWRTAFVALAFLSSFAVLGHRLVVDDGRVLPTRYAVRDGGFDGRYGAISLLALRDAKPPIRVGSVTADGRGGVRVELFDDKAAAPAAVLIAEADLRTLWALARDRDREALRDEAARLVASLAKILRDVRLSPEDSRRADEAIKRVMAVLAQDPRATQASAALLAAMNAAVSPESTGLIGTVASNVGMNAIYGVSDYFRSLVGLEVGGNATGALHDPDLQLRLARIMRRFLADPRTMDAAVALADRTIALVGSDPVLHASFGPLLDSAALRTALSRMAQESATMPVMMLSHVLRLSAEPDLNPLAAAFVSAGLRRSREPVAIALTAAEQARLTRADPRLATSIYEAAP